MVARPLPKGPAAAPYGLPCLCDRRCLGVCVRARLVSGLVWMVCVGRQAIGLGCMLPRPLGAAERGERELGGARWPRGSSAPPYTPLDQLDYHTGRRLRSPGALSACLQSAQAPKAIAAQSSSCAAQPFSPLSAFPPPQRHTLVVAPASSDCQAGYQPTSRTMARWRSHHTTRDPSRRPGGADSDGGAGRVVRAPWGPTACRCRRPVEKVSWGRLPPNLQVHTPHARMPCAHTHTRGMWGVGGARDDDDGLASSAAQSVCLRLMTHAHVWGAPRTCWKQACRPGRAAARLLQWQWPGGRGRGGADAAVRGSAKKWKMWVRAGPPPSTLKAMVNAEDGPLPPHDNVRHVHMHGFHEASGPPTRAFPGSAPATHARNPIGRVPPAPPVAALPCMLQVGAYSQGAPCSGFELAFVMKRQAARHQVPPCQVVNPSTCHVMGGCCCCPKSRTLPSAPVVAMCKRAPHLLLFRSPVFRLVHCTCPPHREVDRKNITTCYVSGRRTMKASDAQRRDNEAGSKQHRPPPPPVCHAHLRSRSRCTVCVLGEQVAHTGPLPSPLP